MADEVPEKRVKSPVKPGDIVGGKYRVERILGSGGMGVVVAATHTELDQPVALKFILPEAVSGKDAIERFMREARSVARLKSEHVARVFDVGRDESDSPYMVLELLEGLDLAKLNKQKGPLIVADAVEYVLQACEALVEAHTAGIVHRDLKPQNIHVGRRLNGMPLVKVLDFGIAKAIGAAAVGQMALTDSQAVMGSPLYMAPEHMRSARAADVRSDIWSLGVILYELLGGQLPFDGDTVTEVCIRVVNEAPPSLLSLRPGLDGSLVTAVMKCLEKDPKARWQNVAQLATALEPFSRSAKQGGPLRPWRSLDDTQDSHPPGPSATPVGGSVSSSSDPQAQSGSPPSTAPADDTGPATAITMPTGENVANAVRGAPPGHAAQASVTPEQAAHHARAHQSSSSPPKPLISTDVSWGQGTDPRQPIPQRPRSFTTGIAVGVVVSIAAAIAIVLFVGARSGANPQDRSQLGPQAREAPSAVAAAQPLPTQPTASETPPPALPVMGTSVTPATLPNAPAAAPSVKPPRTPFTPTGRARAGSGSEPARANENSARSTAAPTNPTAPAETQAPNGAPILR